MLAGRLGVSSYSQLAESLTRLKEAGYAGMRKKPNRYLRVWINKAGKDRLAAVDAPLAEFPALRNTYQPGWVEVVLALTALGIAVVIVATSLYLVVRNEEVVGGNLVIVLRTLLSLAVSVLGGTVPGFLHVDLTSARGISIRAGGALALFLITYLFSPKVVPERVAAVVEHIDQVVVETRALLNTKVAELERTNKQLEQALSRRRLAEKQMYLGVAQASGKAEVIAELAPSDTTKGLADTLAKLVRQIETEFDQATFTPEDNLQVRIAKATLAIYEGRLAEVPKLLPEAERDALAAQLDQFDLSRALADYGSRQWKEAHGWFVKILQRHPYDLDTSRFVANCLEKLGRGDEAVRVWDNYITAVEEHSKEGKLTDLPVSVFGRYCRGRANRKLARYKEAATDFRRVIVDLTKLLEDPKWENARILLAMTLDTYGETLIRDDQFLQGIESLAQAIELFDRLGPKLLPQKARALTDLGYAFRSLSARAPELSQRNRVVGRFAWDILQTACYDLAVNHLTRAIDLIEKSLREGQSGSLDLHNELANTLQGRGTTYAIGGDDRLAVADLDRAIVIYGWMVKHEEETDLADDYARTLNNRARIALGEKQYADAIQVLDEVVAIRRPLYKRRPTLEVAINYGINLTNRGIAHLKTGAPDKGLADLEEAVAVLEQAYRSGHTLAAHNLGRALLALAWTQATWPAAKFRNGKRAVEYAQRAVKMLGEDHETLAVRAAAAAEAGEFESAVRDQERAVRQAPDADRMALQARADAYRRMEPYRDDVTAVMLNAPAKTEEWRKAESAFLALLGLSAYETTFRGWFEPTFCSVPLATMSGQFAEDGKPFAWIWTPAHPKYKAMNPQAVKDKCGEPTAVKGPIVYYGRVGFHVTKRGTIAHFIVVDAIDRTRAKPK
jgi:tetratricopeptide (TPR) repeat protein